MKTQSCRLGASCAYALLFPLAVAAQTAAAPDAAHPGRESVVQLNPFEVQEDADNSYGALNSNSMTRFNTELDKMPISADIFTSQFMADVGATSVEDVIQNFSAGAGYSGADPGGSSGNQQPGDRNGNAYITLRGFQTPSMVRDSLMPVGSLGNPGSTGVGVTSNFDTEKVEIIEGPQALLYGQGGAGGVINVVSKQARLGQAARGEMLYRIDQYGSKQAQLDYGAGTDTVAARFSILQQKIGNRRVNVGGPLEGYYGQIAFKLGAQTTVRITGQETTYHRINSNDSAFTALSTTADSRNGDKLNYLLFTQQTGAINPVTGAAYGSGAIDNGNLNWGNVNSFEGWWASELTVNRFTDIVADSVWTPWLATEVSAGYDDYYDDRVNDSFSFFAPQATANKTGVWAGQLTPGDTEEPVQTKAVRVSAVITNAWGRLGKSQTILGADEIAAKQGEFAYEYFQADSGFNVTYGAANTLNGRSALAAQQWPLTNGPMLYNLFAPRSKRVTVNGVNYVRMLQNPVDPHAVSPADPLGVTLGGANYSEGHITNRGAFAANYSNWLDGRLDTLVGLRIAKSVADDYNQGSAPPSAPKAFRVADKVSKSFNVGADYQVASWLHPYATVSDSDDPPVSESADPYGVLPQTAHGISEEVGLKLNSADKRLSGQLAFYHARSTNEQLTLSSTIENDVNPSGLNGRWNSPNQWINIDRGSQGAKLTVTGAPSRNWRMRLSAAFINGKVLSTKSYGQLYNDSFHADSAGNVTYADGEIVYVNPTYNSKATTVEAPQSRALAGMVPLTVAMMNNAASPYFANPQNVTGQISSSTAVYQVLKSTDATAGSIATGQTGLPITAIQYNAASNSTISGYVPPPGTIVAAKNGDLTSGYPEYALVFTNLNTVGSGWCKGLRVGETLHGYWNYRFYYYYAGGVTPSGQGRTLFYKPNYASIDLILGYSHKFGRIAWSMQLNVSNLLNHYDVILLPGQNTGYTPSGSDATFTAQPRAYVWTNTIRF